LGDYSPPYGGFTVTGAPNHPDLLQVFAVLPCMSDPLANHGCEMPRAPCEVHALQRFPLITSPSPFGPDATLPFFRASRPCSDDQSLDSVGRPFAVRFPLLDFALRSFLVAPFPFSFPKDPFLPLRHSAEYFTPATCQPCCHSASPSVLPPHLRVFSDAGCDCYQPNLS
jgi:hypothetical protein